MAFREGFLEVVSPELSLRKSTRFSGEGKGIIGAEKACLNSTEGTKVRDRLER